MSISQKQKDLVAEFSKFSNWEDRYKLIIAKGKSLAELPTELKLEANQVKGCQSQVWLVASLTDNGLMKLQGDSDAMIVKGLVSLLLEVYSEQDPTEVLQNPPDFLKQLGFDGNLSPSRANGLSSMIKQIMYYAAAFQYLKAQRK